MKRTIGLLFALALVAGLLIGVKAINLKNGIGSGKSQPVAKSSPPEEVEVISPTEIPVNKFISIIINGEELSVEVAKSTAEINEGLSGRTEIGSDGMLFVIDPPAKPGFWMKNMLFSIDIVWINGDRVIGINSNVDVPESAVTVSDLPIYYPDQPVNFVLEIPAGSAKDFINVGDKITIPKLK